MTTKKNSHARQSKTSSKKAAAKAPTITDLQAIPEVQGSEAAYLQFLPRARALDAQDVVHLNGDLALAYRNVCVGSANVLAEGDRLRRVAPEADREMIAVLPNLALATLYAAQRVPVTSDGSMQHNLAEARALRGVFRPIAHGLAAAGHLNARDVAKIERGNGPIDGATDLVDYSALFRANEVAIRGKHPITAAMISRASSLGTELLTQLRPKRAKVVKSKELTEAVDLRNRFWTLLIKDRAEMWKAGAALFGETLVGEKVPALQSHVANVKHRAKKTETQPATPR